MPIITERQAWNKEINAIKEAMSGKTYQLFFVAQFKSCKFNQE
jgi:hypothetical protein